MHYSMYNIIYLRVSNFRYIHGCYNVDNIQDSFVHDVWISINHNFGQIHNVVFVKP